MIVFLPVFAGVVELGLFLFFPLYLYNIVLAKEGMISFVRSLGCSFV